jgi:hypothetical protein
MNCADANREIHPACLAGWSMVGVLGILESILVLDRGVAAD